MTCSAKLNLVNYAEAPRRWSGMFGDMGHMEQVTHCEFRGQSMGASFRVTKGVYVHPGTFRGKSVESKSMEPHGLRSAGRHDEAHLSTSRAARRASG